MIDIAGTVGALVQGAEEVGISEWSSLHRPQSWLRAWCWPAMGTSAYVTLCRALVRTSASNLSGHSSLPPSHGAPNPYSALCLARFAAVQAVEVLPYHLLGLQKWEEMGLEYPLKSQRTPTTDETLAFTRHVSNAGINVLCNKLS